MHINFQADLEKAKKAAEYTKGVMTAAGMVHARVGQKLVNNKITRFLGD